MRPTLCAGDRVVALRYGGAVAAGRIVVLSLSDAKRREWIRAAGEDVERWGVPRHIVKRVVAVGDDDAVSHAGVPFLGSGELYVVGDGDTSMDSRRLGPFDKSDVLGVVVRWSGHSRRPGGRRGGRSGRREP